MEVHQQPNPNSTQPQVCQQLSVVNRKQFFNAIQFHYDRFLNNEIYAIATVQLNSFVSNWKLHLSRNVSAIRLRSWQRHSS